ncbi:MAG TPA: DUF3293 domain-containing protein [Fontimonas sp.]
MTTQPERAALEAAYRAAQYRIVLAQGRIVRHVGRIDAAADAALAGAGCRRHWAIVTPCNPGAQRLSDRENAARLAALIRDLEARALRHLPAINAAQDGSWPEPGCCILDAPAALIESLAVQYGQLAYLSAGLGEAPALLWTAP